MSEESLPYPHPTPIFLSGTAAPSPAGRWALADQPQRLRVALLAATPATPACTLSGRRVLGYQADPCGSECDTVGPEAAQGG